MSSGEPVGHDWADRVRGVLPRLAKDHSIAPTILSGASVLLHGSITRGVDDAYSDLDVWLLPPIESPRQFVEFRVENKSG